MFQFLRHFCKLKVKEEPHNNDLIAEYDCDTLRNNAKRYKKVSKGSDHFLASELVAFPDCALAPIAKAVDFGVVAMSWALQLLMNLNPELAKASGGQRTITKTPKLYRLWAKSRAHIVKTWEGTIRSKYDTAVKGMSALTAAADRSLWAEIQHYLGRESALALWDMEKFFDSISPEVLVDALNHTNFPPVDTIMGMQMHLAPRVIQVQQLSSLPMRIDTSILAGCFYSVPWVKATLYKGCTILDQESQDKNNEHPVIIKTYVDDITQAAKGTFSEVVDALIRATNRFQLYVVQANKLILASKSTIVASSLRLAQTICDELATYGIKVAVSNSHRDVGVEYTAAKFRSIKAVRSRFHKAGIRQTRIKSLSHITRFAKFLFSTGTYNQATWGHEVVGLSNTDILTLT